MNTVSKSFKSEEVVRVSLISYLWMTYSFHKSNTWKYNVSFPRFRLLLLVENKPLTRTNVPFSSIKIPQTSFTSTSVLYLASKNVFETLNILVSPYIFKEQVLLPLSPSLKSSLTDWHLRNPKSYHKQVEQFSSESRQLHY